MALEMELVDSVPAPAPAVEATPSPTPAEPVVAEPVVEATPAVATPAEPTTEAPAVEPATPQLYKLPDGREVDAAGLQREYENLLPEFTRKSQRLAELEKPNITKEEPAWKNPDFAPTTWAEAIEIAKAAALEELNGQTTQKAAEEAARFTMVETQLNEVKAIDPKVNEDALFEHAVKFGFQDLKSAHSNMKAMQDLALATEQRVLKNIETRAADPIATTPTPPPAPSTTTYAATGRENFRGALDFLDALKSKS